MRVSNIRASAPGSYGFATYLRVGIRFSPKDGLRNVSHPQVTVSLARFHGSCSTLLNVRSTTEMILGLLDSVRLR